MSVVSERDVLRDALCELASELDAIEALFPDGLEEISLRLHEARTGIRLTLEEANGHRSRPLLARVSSRGTPASTWASRFTPDHSPGD
jgi:hypothetical protein